MRLSALSLCLIAALAACSDAPRYGGSAPLPEARITSRYRAIEVVQVTLPAYGELEDIHLRKSDGTITRMGGFWADDPARAITLQLARDLGAITGAISAPDPWPFRDLADVRIDVRIEEFLAAEEGAFLLSGQYFVAPENGGSDRARRFDISVPVALPLSPSAIVAARGAAVARLATMIAETGLR